MRDQFLLMSEALVCWKRWNFSCNVLSLQILGEYYRRKAGILKYISSTINFIYQRITFLATIWCSAPGVFRTVFLFHTSTKRYACPVTMLRIPNSNLLRYSFLICLLFLESIIYILFLQTFLFFLNKIHLYPKKVTEVSNIYTSIQMLMGIQKTCCIKQ